jgi:hypothetical protein
VTWKHPDEVPTSLTRRAYALRGIKISQNTYASVVADAYDDVKNDVFRQVLRTCDEVLKDQIGGIRDTPATRATADLLDLPWEVVASVLDVFTQEASRLASERRATRGKR